MEKAREEICSAVRKLEPNVEALRLLRLTKGEFRERLKGRLGGAILLLAAAESLRRVAEKIFDKKLPEEDELLSGWGSQSFKKRVYGSERLLDGDPAITRRYLRSLTLDRGVRVRWYVEGDTEFGALEEFFGNFAPTYVDIVNLSARVTEKGELAFLRSLKRDIEHEVFSFVLIDSDRKDNARALKKAAAREQFFGRFVLSDPDFAFHNFSHDELGDILWKVAEERGASEVSDKAQLLAAIKSAKNENQLLATAERALPQFLGRISKNAEWGRRLMRYALRHPKSAGGEDRPIIGALHEAIRCCVVYDYKIGREQCKSDAETGRMVKR